MKKKLSLKTPGRWSLIRRAAVVACLSAFTLLLTRVQAAERQVLQGHIPLAVASLHLQPVNALATSQRLKLAISLPLRNNEALTNLLEQIYDPASPNYHHYLTPQQFTEQFGPTEQDYQAVIAFAQANGLTVTGTHPNRVLLDVDGSVAEVQKAFHVTMRVFQHPVENRTFYAPDVEPSLDLSVPVSGIIGLNNYVLPRPLFRRASGSQSSANRSLTGSAPDGSGSYFGYDFRNAYAPGASLTGTGQKVALFECADYFTNDIGQYVSLAGLPSVPLTNVSVDGGPPAAVSGDGVNVEVALDIEMAICMAPGLSKIIVYEGPGDSTSVDADILNKIANDNKAKQISSSWVIGDSSQYAAIYTQFAMQGQTFLQASGDEGAYYSGIFQYEDSPLVTLVGGTTLTTGAGGVWSSEKVWNWGDGIAGGGGISTTYLIPSWQTGISMTLNRGSITHRNVPDVALTADNIFVIADNGEEEPGVGGTSCAAPLWAGFAALINQQAALLGTTNVGFLNPAIYAIGKGTSYNSVFHDIKTGNNTTPSSPTKYFAVNGYDLCTGWGTPNGTNLINALVQLPDALQITPNAGLSASFNVGSQPGGAQSFSLTNTGASALSWFLVNTSLWLNVSPTNGSLAAHGRTNVAVSLNPSTTTGLPAGSYVSTIFFTDLATSFNQSRPVTLQVLPLISNGGFETGDFTDWNLSGNVTNMFVTGSPVFVYDGNYSASLGPIGSLGYLFQIVPTVPGQAYLLSFWVQNANGGLPSEFNVSWNGNIIYDQTNLPPFDWTNLQFVVTATGSSSTLQFGFRNDPQFFGLDDVSLNPTYIPVFQMLTHTSSTFGFSWNAVPGTVYQLQYTTNLSQSAWLDLGGAITAADVTVSTNDVIGPDPHRFYRLMVLP
jgi:subtilase family serine protease